MATLAQEGIEEIYVIKTDEIDLLGALVKKQKDQSAVSGRIVFKDGHGLYFHSPAGERSAAKEKLADLCERIADVYGTCLFHKVFEKALEYDTFLEILRRAKYHLN